MGLRKSIGHLIHDILGYGPITGLRVLRLKTKRSGPPERVSVRRLGGSVLLRPGTTDPAIFDQIALHPYVPIDREHPPVTIVDLGANIGLSTRFLKNAYPEARVVAVEPDPTNYEMLVKNTAGLSDVQCLMAGIWPEDGRLQLDHAGLGHSGFRTHAGGDGGGNTDALTIGTLMTKAGFERIGLLKIDIEGAEKDLFGGTDLSWLEKVDRIAIELHDHIRPGAGQVFFEALRKDSWNVRIYHGVVYCERTQSVQS